MPIILLVKRPHRKSSPRGSVAQKVDEDIQGGRVPLSPLPTSGAQHQAENLQTYSLPHSTWVRDESPHYSNYWPCLKSGHCSLSCIEIELFVHDLETQWQIVK